MKLPKLEEAIVNGKRVLVRLDLDCEPDTHEFRIKASFPTLDYLKSKNCQIVILGHRGRPDGKPDERLSLKPFQSIFNKWGARVEENLRFDLGEESNDVGFVQKLASLGDFYVNDAFAASHREHASIIGLPRLLPHAAGLRLTAEVENLSKMFDNPARPVVGIIGGVKEDKLEYLSGLAKICNKVLIAGRLPWLIENSKFKIQNFKSKIKIASLLPDTEDITIHSIENFKEEIGEAKTILLAGACGKFEEEGHRQGTKEVFRAVAESSAFKIAGGGDTLAAIKLLGLEPAFNWLSVGGGAMLEFICKGTLLGIEALK